MKRYPFKGKIFYLSLHRVSLKIKNNYKGFKCKFQELVSNKLYINSKRGFHRYSERNMKSSKEHKFKLKV